MTPLKLQQLADSDQDWTLDEIAQQVNDWLPQILPPSDAARRGTDDINPRLVRHYVSQGLVDKPQRIGREVRYGYRHLLQLLVVRRLLAEGYTSGAIASLMTGQTNADLEALLQGGVQLTLEAANPALHFLQSLKSSQTSSQPSSTPASLNRRQQAASTDSQTWSHLPVMPGVELLIRADVPLPKTSQEEAGFLQLVAQTLQQFFQQNSQ